jgi:hypothetical protein
MPERKSTADPPIKEWVTRVNTEATLTHQKKIVDFLLWAYGGLLVSTMLIFFLQGFKVGNFSLDSALLKWLGGATIGEIGGLLILTLKAVFRKSADLN